jgi:hypothetical protein
MDKSSLLDRLKKSGSVKNVTTLADSCFFNKKDTIPTSIPILNIALSGTLSGGLSPGITIIAGPSRHFKSLLGLILVKAYMDKYPDAVCLFFDSEYGITPEYIKTNGIDIDRVLHIPVEHLEQLKFDIAKRLEEIKRGDHVIVFMDSIGNLASKKEYEDALDEKSVADMTRSKVIKGIFRIITPHFTTKDIPCIVVNHTYQEMCLEGSTLIKTENGPTAIKDIMVGDRVYSLSGLQKVLAVYGPTDLDPTDKRFLEVEFDDGSFVRCTHDHKFYTKQGEWQEAIDLKIGQEMY